MADTNVHTRALLVWLQIRSWSARKYDRAVSEKTNRDHGASSGSSRTNKALLSKHDRSYSALMTLIGSLRTWHYGETLAWSDAGDRLLTTDNFMHYADTLRVKINEINNAIDAFACDYPTLRLEASQRLGGMYNSADYPDAADIRNRFGVTVAYKPVPAEGDIRVDLAADQVEAIKASIAASNSASVEHAMHDAWSRLHDVVQSAAIKLADPSAIFRDSLINNVSEICGVLERLNVTGDADLDAMRVEALNKIAHLNPDTIRGSKLLREQTANDAADILAKMSQFFQPAA
jgi:hypothetical protein